MAEPTEQAGIPQLDFSAFPNQIFWLVVFLTILFLVVNRVVLPRIGGIIDLREKRIRGDLEQAEGNDEHAARLNQETEDRLSMARKEAEQIAAEARSRAREIQDKAVAEAATTIAARTAAAEARIEEIRASARQSVREIASDVALEIVDQLLPGRSDGQLVSKAVDKRMAGEVH